METHENPAASPEAPAQPVEAPRPRLRWGRLLAWTGLIMLLVVVGVTLLMNQRGPIQQGQPVPDFTLKTFEGQEIALADLRGQVVVINFWASWCKPCEQEAPDLEAAWRHYQPGGEVMFLGIAYTDTDRKSRAYLEKFDITYPNGLDWRTQISHRYRVTGVPETFILDKDGLLVHYKQGPFLSQAELMALIEPLLK
jgi:cytochrome c biogenesis protein CcmG, thiol:disulfide interchange protein DsbE